jgi:hypothetical protein
VLSRRTSPQVTGGQHEHVRLHHRCAPRGAGTAPPSPPTISSTAAASSGRRHVFHVSRHMDHLPVKARGCTHVRRRAHTRSSGPAALVRPPSPTLRHRRPPNRHVPRTASHHCTVSTTRIACCGRPDRPAVASVQRCSDRGALPSHSATQHHRRLRHGEVVAVHTCESGDQHVARRDRLARPRARERASRTAPPASGGSRSKARAPESQIEVRRPSGG